VHLNLVILLLLVNCSLTDFITAPKDLSRSNPLSLLLTVMEVIRKMLFCASQAGLSTVAVQFHSG